MINTVILYCNIIFFQTAVLQEDFEFLIAQVRCQVEIVRNVTTMTKKSGVSWSNMDCTLVHVAWLFVEHWKEDLASEDLASHAPSENTTREFRWDSAEDWTAHRQGTHLVQEPLDPRMIVYVPLKLAITLVCDSAFKMLWFDIVLWLIHDFFHNRLRAFFI